MASFRGNSDDGPFAAPDGDDWALPLDPRPLIKWGLIIGAVIGLLVVANLLRQIYTNWLWFTDLDYSDVYLRVLTTKVWLFFLGAFAFTLIIVPNAIFAYKSSKGEAGIPVSQQVYDVITQLFRWGIALAIFLLAIIFGSLVSGQWETLLRFINEVPFTTVDPASGQNILAQDPVFNKNVAFYVFTLPVHSLAQGWLLGALIVTLVGSAAIYMLNLSLRGVTIAVGITPRMIAHASILLGLLLLVTTWNNWIEIHKLLFSPSGAIFGAGYTELNARLPALRILLVISAVVGLLLLANARFRSTRLIVASIGVWVAAAIIVGNVYPALVQRFQVNPNELEREREYIPRSIDFTRQGFALNRIEEEDYNLATISSGDEAGELAPLSAATVAANPESIDNIRLWDHRPLRSVYNQIQVFRAYYRYVDVDVDRYVINGQTRQVMLGARELFPEDLPEESQSWVNRRLQFTHGFGVAMSPTTEFTTEGRPDFFIKDIPPGPGKETLAGLVPEVTQPQIYYGENSANYVIVNSLEPEFDYPAIDTDSPIRTSYAGEGGIHISSLLRRMAYAWEFADINILISGALGPDSRIQYRREIQDRVREIAPFLMLDHDPYLVVADGKLWWMQDAYTTTSQYPYSDPYQDEFNYIRNSVKVVIDAYNGDTDFYIFDEDDAIVRTYDKVFPTLFKPKSEMPESLRSHIRYPQDFFSIQAEKYLLYHMRDTIDFYNREDPWSVPRELFFETEQPMEPYYVIMKLPGEEEEEFVLLLPFTPLDKPNQVAWLAARSDDDKGQYGSLKSFLFPKGTQVDGPEQVEARIDNDFTIKQQFTLLCQRGARCIRGNLLVIPIVHEDEQFLMYVEPLYIQAENIAFPELKQVIVADAKKVVMEDSLWSALNALVEGDLPDDTLPPDAAGPPDATTPPGDGPPAITDAEDLKEAIDEIRQALDRLEEALDEILQPTEGGAQ